MVRMVCRFHGQAARDVGVVGRAAIFARMRRLIGLFLLAILVHGTLVVLPAGLLLRHQARRDMRHGLRQGASRGGARFRFSMRDAQIVEPGFTWEEEGREFLWQGRLYDVVAIAYGDGVCDVDCAADVAETGWLKLVRCFLPDKREHGASSPGHAPLKLRLDPFIPWELPLACAPVRAAAVRSAHPAALRFPGHGRVPTPPPWC